MRAFPGRSQETDARAVVAELAVGWPDQPSVVMVFTSSRQDPAAVGQALAERYPGCPVVGCTTSGETLDGVHSRGAVVATALLGADSAWATARLDALHAFVPEQAAGAVETLLARLGVDRETFDPKHYVCFLFIDGLARREEAVAASVAEALGGIPLVGGSAGDDLAFKETRVIEGGRATSDAAVLLLAHVPGGYEILKHQHFVKTETTMVVTKVNAGERRVFELDGRPAAEAYARALGLPRAALTADVLFSHPVSLTCGQETFVRSVQRVEADDSLVFYCAVERGMVLELARHASMADTLARDLAVVRARQGRAGAMILYNCILRALEATETGQHERLGELLRESAESSIGFDTYGEQLNGLHINQTMIAVAFPPGP